MEAGVTEWGGDDAVGGGNSTPLFVILANAGIPLVFFCFAVQNHPEGQNGPSFAGMTGGVGE